MSHSLGYIEEASAPGVQKTLESLPPELLEMIFLELPFTDLLKLCQTSSYFRSFCLDWDLWAHRMYLINEFPPDLFKETSLPTPQQRYQQLINFYEHPSESLIKAAETGKIGIIQDMIQIATILSLSYHALERALLAAVELGHLDVVKLLIPVVMRLLDQAAEHGTETALIESLRSDLYARALKFAAGYGRINVVEYLIDLSGPTNKLKLILNDALLVAASNGQINMARFLIQKGATDLNNALRAAAHSDHIDLARYLISNGATDIGTALIWASMGGHLPMVRFLLLTGAVKKEDLDEALIEASRMGRLDVVKELIDVGATQLIQALLTAEHSFNSRVEKVREYLRSIISERTHGAT